MSAVANSSVDVAARTLRLDGDRDSNEYVLQLVQRALEIIKVENACGLLAAAEHIRSRATQHGLPILSVATAVVTLGGARPAS